MNNTFDIIQPSIESSFRTFISQILRLDDEPLKYYYWTTDFYENNGELIFSYFELDPDQKEDINSIGQSFFDDSEVYFEVNRNSHRHDLLIKNIHKLFPEGKKSGQSNRYEYIKEYIFWKILEQLNSDENKISKSVLEIQRRNFLITYLKYLITFTNKPSFDEFKDYIRYTLTSQGEDLEKKLKELDEKGVDNSNLREKLSKLYVHRSAETKIHFVFSRIGGEEKEELRELLDVMGREENGNLYRGQANSTWKLDASLTRDKKYRNHEVEMYYDILSLKPDAFINDHTVYERLITMQHFGMPTRLMDVTRNPLVAIFFACNNLDRAKSDGVVYTFAPEPKDFLNFEDQKLDSLKKLFDKKNGENRPDDFLAGVWFIKGVAKNQRISNQSGDFIFVGDGDKIQEKLRDLPNLVIVIDAPTKHVLLEQLESLNIHGGAVYPDLTHMSNYIRNKYLYEKHIGKDLMIDINLSEFDFDLKKNKANTKKSQEPYKVRELTIDLKMDTFWTKKRQSRLNQFVKANSLDPVGAKLILEEIIAFDKEPIRSDVAKIINPKPKLKEYEMVVEPLINQMDAFAKELKNTKE